MLLRLLNGLRRAERFREPPAVGISPLSGWTFERRSEYGRGGGGGGGLTAANAARHRRHATAVSARSTNDGSAAAAAAAAAVGAPPTVKQHATSSGLRLPRTSAGSVAAVAASAAPKSAGGERIMSMTESCSYELHNTRGAAAAVLRGERRRGRALVACEAALDVALAGLLVVVQSALRRRQLEEERPVRLPSGLAPPAEPPFAEDGAVREGARVRRERAARRRLGEVAQLARRRRRGRRDAAARPHPPAPADVDGLLLARLSARARVAHDLVGEEEPPELGEVDAVQPALGLVALGQVAHPPLARPLPARRARHLVDRLLARGVHAVGPRLRVGRLEVRGVLGAPAVQRRREPLVLEALVLRHVGREVRPHQSWRRRAARRRRGRRRALRARRRLVLQL